MTPSSVEKYERILQADPRSRIFVELARALLEAGDPARAAQVCAQGLQHHPDSFHGRILWGRALLRLGDPGEAVARFEEAIASDPSGAYGYDLAGEALLQHGETARALALLERGAATHPGDRRVRRWLEDARQAAGLPPESTLPLWAEPASPAGPQGRAGEAPAATAPGAQDAAAGTPGDDATGSAPAGDGLVTAVMAAVPLPPRAPIALPTPAPPPSPDDLDAASAEAARPAPPAAAQPPALTPPPRQRPPAPAASELRSAARFLDLLPEVKERAPAPPAAAPPREEEVRQAEAEAHSYEHELRAKLMPDATARPGFVRRHLRALVGAAVAIAALAGVTVFFTVRSQRRTGEARAAVDAARKGLARDTAGAVREAARVLAEAREVLSKDRPAAVLAAEAAAVLAHDHGDEAARATAQEILAELPPEVAPGARFLLAPEDRAAATALLDRATGGSPFDRAVAGELLLSRRDLEGARLHLEAAARASPPLLRAVAALGDLELARSDPEAALTRDLAALKVHPSHPRAAIGAAEACLRLGRQLGDALHALEAVDADPESTPRLDDRLRLDLALARLLGAAGRGAEAERRLREAEARQPLNPGLALVEAEVLASAGDLDHALRAAERAVRLAPRDDPGPRELLARLQLRRGRFRELLAATESAPTRTLRVYRGVARLELGDAARAAAELEATRRDGKTTTEAASWLALAEVARGRRPQAVALTAALLVTAAPPAPALVAKGRLELLGKRPDLAEKRFREAIQRDPDLMVARRDLGRLLLERGRAREAREVLDKAVARAPYDLEARRDLGRAALAAGDPSGARRELELVVAERRDDATAWLSLASTYLALNQAAEGRRAAEQALRLAPRSSRAALLAGKAAAAAGAPSEARRHLQLAVKLAGRGPEAADARRALATLRR